MRLTVFGGTGGTGTAIIDLALAAGHEVMAFIRDQSRLKRPDQVRMIESDLKHAHRIDEAIAGSEAVLVALGPRNSPPELITTGLRHIITSMEQRGIKRIIAVSCARMRTPHESTPLVERISVLLAAAAARRDIVAKQEQLRLLSSSSLEWTALRAGRLARTAASGKYRFDDDRTHSNAPLSREDLAHAVMTELEAGVYVRKAPFVSAA